MQLTYNAARQRTDDNGKSFLDIDLSLTLSETNNHRLTVSIPATANDESIPLLNSGGDQSLSINK